MIEAMFAATTMLEISRRPQPLRSPVTVGGAVIFPRKQLPAPILKSLRQFRRGGQCGVF